jgi:hypothetical protein
LETFSARLETLYRAWQRPSALLETPFLHPGNDFNVPSRPHRFPGNASSVGGKPFPVEERCRGIAGTYVRFERSSCDVERASATFAVTHRLLYVTPFRIAVTSRPIDGAVREEEVSSGQPSTCSPTGSPSSAATSRRKPTTSRRRFIASGRRLAV